MIATLPDAVVLRSNGLIIRTATEPLEISQLRAVLDEQHYLKAGRPAGHVLWQGAWEHDAQSGIERLVAVFCWAGAAKRLKDRDEWIGWDSVKDLGGKGTLGAIITLCHHRTGAPLAMATYSGSKHDCELPVGQALLEQATELLPHAVITTDALHSQKKRR